MPTVVAFVGLALAWGSPIVRVHQDCPDRRHGAAHDGHVAAGHRDRVPAAPAASDGRLPPPQPRRAPPRGHPGAAQRGHPVRVHRLGPSSGSHPPWARCSTAPCPCSRSCSRRSSCPTSRSPPGGSRAWRSASGRAAAGPPPPGWRRHHGRHDAAAGRAGRDAGRRGVCLGLRVRPQERDRQADDWRPAAACGWPRRWGTRLPRACWRCP